MATVTLGNIKFNWKGPYNNSTAYVVDDVVSSGGSSYVCILASTGNAVSNGTYWQQMSAAGTNGTDLTSTLTTQGDIVYRDGSGLARLGYGTAGQVLQTGGSGANPSWGTVSSDWVKLGKTDLTSVASVSFQDIFTADYDIYKVFVNGVASSSGNQNLYFRWLTSGSTEDSGSNYNGMHDITYRQESNNNRAQATDAYNGASAYRITGWGAIGDTGTWSGMDNWELTLYDPKRNHKSTSAKGGNIVFVSGYMYHDTYQISQRGNLWHNDTGSANSFGGFKLYLENSTNFQAIGTISVYGIKA